MRRACDRDAFRVVLIGCRRREQRKPATRSPVRVFNLAALGRGEHQPAILAGAEHDADFVEARIAPLEEIAQRGGQWDRPPRVLSLERSPSAMRELLPHLQHTSLEVDQKRKYERP